MPDIARLNEIYTMLRHSASFEDAWFTIADARGLTLADRNFNGVGPPEWWIGTGEDEASYVRLLSPPSGLAPYHDAQD